jgi:hypothetical protein
VGRAAASAIMMRQFYEQVGLPVRAVIQSDSSAARGMASRIGCGKIRHLQIRDLWIQERVRSGDLLLEKALTADNTSDLGTKHIDAKRIEKLVGLSGMSFRVGEAGQAVVKGLAVGALLTRQTVVAAAAAPGEANLRSSNVDSLLLLAFAAGACSMALLVCICWCWCRKRHPSPSMQALVDSTSGRHGNEETAAAAASRLTSASGSSTGRPCGSERAAAAAAPASGVLRVRTIGSTRGPAMVLPTLAAQLEMLTVKELKNELRAKHMPVSGLRADLVARLMK